MILVFHKPYGVLSQFTPEPLSAFTTLADFHFPENVYPIGRLDADSEGLLVLSDEKTLPKKIIAADSNHPRTYWVQVDGSITTEACTQLANGVTLGNYTTKKSTVEIISTPDIPERIPPIRVRKNIPTTWLQLTLTEGKNRQVRKMTASVGFPTLRLVRAGVGGFWLGNLPQGTWRELSAAEKLLLLGLP